MLHFTVTKFELCVYLDDVKRRRKNVDVETVPSSVIRRNELVLRDLHATCTSSVFPCESRQSPRRGVDMAAVRPESVRPPSVDRVRWHREHVRQFQQNRLLDDFRYASSLRTSRPRLPDRNLSRTRRCRNPRDHVPSLVGLVWSLISVGKFDAHLHCIGIKAELITR